MPSTVYVVHCVDSEGPLYESLSATFGRLGTIFHLDLEPSKALLANLRAGEVDLGGLEKAVQKVLDPQLLNYNDTWDKIDSVLGEALSSRFRNRLLDSGGRGVGLQLVLRRPCGLRGESSAARREADPIPAPMAYRVAGSRRVPHGPAGTRELGGECYVVIPTRPESRSIFG